MRGFNDWLSRLVTQSFKTADVLYGDSSFVKSFPLSKLPRPNFYSNISESTNSETKFTPMSGNRINPDHYFILLKVLGGKFQNLSALIGKFNEEMMAIRVECSRVDNVPFYSGFQNSVNIETPTVSVTSDYLANFYDEFIVFKSGFYCIRCLCFIGSDTGSLRDHVQHHFVYDTLKTSAPTRSCYHCSRVFPMKTLSDKSELRRHCNEAHQIDLYSQFEHLKLFGIFILSHTRFFPFVPVKF